MPKSSVYPDLERKKGGPDNWVEAVGGLPSYIERIAKHLHYEKGHSISSAIAMAVNTVKRWAKGTNHNGGKLKPQTVAKAAKAVAQWEAKKGRANAKRLKESSILMSPEECEGLGKALSTRLALLEGMLPALESGRRSAVNNASALLEATDSKITLDLSPGQADARKVAETRAALVEETEELRSLIDGFGLELEEAPRGTKAKAVKPVATMTPKQKQEEDESKSSDDPAKRVQHLQRRLTSIGHELRDDGDFGPKTDAAVKEFQRNAGLKEDGVVGPKTTDALRTAPTPEEMAAIQDELDAASTPVGEPGGSASNSASSPGVSPGGMPAPVPGSQAKDTPVLYKGVGVGSDEGDPAVVEMQGSLNKVGHNLEPDGKFGPKTDKSVKSFQRRWGLKSDGLVGPKTKAALRDAEFSVDRLTEAVEERQAAFEANDANAFARARAREKTLRRRVEEGDSRHDFMDMPKKCPKCGKKKCKHLAEGAVRGYSRAGKPVRPHWRGGTPGVSTVKKITDEEFVETGDGIGRVEDFGLTGVKVAFADGSMRTYSEYELAPVDDPDEVPDRLREASVRGAARKVVAELKRLPDGTFAPKGRGQILRAGDEVSVPHKSGKGTVPGRVEQQVGSAVAIVRLEDGPDAGQKVEAKMGDYFPSKPGQDSPGTALLPKEQGKAAGKALIGKKQPPNLRTAEKLSDQPKPKGKLAPEKEAEQKGASPPALGGPGVAKPKGKVASKPDAAMPEGRSAPPKSGQDSPGTGRSEMSKKALHKNFVSQGKQSLAQTIADLEKAGDDPGALEIAKAAMREKEAKSKGKAAGKKQSEDKNAKAVAAHPEGSSVTTTVHGIGGKSEKVTGKVVGHKRGQLAVKTENHGTLMVSLDKVESKGAPPEPEKGSAEEKAAQARNAAANKERYGKENAFEKPPTAGQDSPGTDPTADPKFAVGEKLTAPNGQTWTVTDHHEGKVWAQREGEQTAGPIDTSQNWTAAGAGQDSPGTGMVPNPDGRSIKDLPLGSTVKLADGQEYVVHKHVNDPWMIIKPVGGGKAKPMHKMAPPVEYDESTAYDAQGDAPAAPGYTPSAAAYEAGGKSILDSPGRGPTGKLRNFKAMSPQKLKKVVAELDEFGDDPEALDAAANAAASKGISLPDPKPKTSTAQTGDFVGTPVGTPDPKAHPDYVDYSGIGKKAAKPDGGDLMSQMEKSIDIAKTAKAKGEEPDFKQQGKDAAKKLPKAPKKPSPGSAEAGQAAVAAAQDDPDMLAGEHGAVPLSELSDDEIDTELVNANKAVDTFAAIKDSMIYSKPLHDKAIAVMEQLSAEKAKRAAAPKDGEAKNAALEAYKANGGSDPAVIEMLKKAA